MSKIVCLIVISQYREKIGVMFGNPTTTQGGHALKFYSDVRVEVSRSLAKDGDVTYGNITKLKGIKNKMSPPYRLSQFEIVYGVGIDPYYMYIDDTINLVNTDYVNSNMELMKTRVSKSKVDDEEIYEFDEDGDLMSLVFD